MWSVRKCKTVCTCGAVHRALRFIRGVKRLSGLAGDLCIKPFVLSLSSLRRCLSLTVDVGEEVAASDERHPDLAVARCGTAGSGASAEADPGAWEDEAAPELEKTKPHQRRRRRRSRRRGRRKAPMNCTCPGGDGIEGRRGFVVPTAWLAAVASSFDWRRVAMGVGGSS